jgi:hypothetical protein
MAWGDATCTVTVERDGQASEAGDVFCGVLHYAAPLEGSTTRYAATDQITLAGDRLLLSRDNARTVVVDLAEPTIMDRPYRSPDDGGQTLFGSTVTVQAPAPTADATVTVLDLVSGEKRWAVHGLDHPQVRLTGNDVVITTPVSPQPFGPSGTQVTVYDAASGMVQAQVPAADAWLVGDGWLLVAPALSPDELRLIRF